MTREQIKFFPILQIKVQNQKLIFVFLKQNIWGSSFEKAKHMLGKKSQFYFQKDRLKICMCI